MASPAGWRDRALRRFAPPGRWRVPVHPDDDRLTLWPGALPRHADTRFGGWRRALLPAVRSLIEASGADFRIGGGEAYYSPGEDMVVVPPQAAFGEPINWYRTTLHELGHWTGHASRLDRDQRGRFGSADYAREELVAEMASAFACASLSIRPTVRHADYIASWLKVLRDDDHAIFRAARAAGKAADYLLAFVPESEA